MACSEITAPGKARVFVDGTDAGGGPLSSSVQRAGYHQVRIDQDGKHTQYVIEVRAGKTTSRQVLAAAVKRIASACVAADPAGAGLLVQARFRGGLRPGAGRSGRRRRRASTGLEHARRVVLDVVRRPRRLHARSSRRPARLRRSVDAGRPAPGLAGRERDDEMVEHEGATWLRVAIARRSRRASTGPRSRATIRTAARTSRRASAGCSLARPRRLDRRQARRRAGRSARARRASSSRARRYR